MDAVQFLKNACQNELPKELELQLKSGAMKISLQPKKASTNVPSLGKNIPGPPIGNDFGQIPLIRIIFACNCLDV